MVKIQIKRINFIHQLYPFTSAASLFYQTRRLMACILLIPYLFDKFYIMLTSLGNRLSKSSKRHLKPPTLKTSQMFSSTDRNQLQTNTFPQLSNVEQNSYVSSSNNDQQSTYLKEMLNKIHKEDSQPSNPSEPSSPKIQRLSSMCPRMEDLQIIAVQEEINVDDIKGSEESVILEQIDFHNQPKEPSRQLAFFQAEHSSHQDQRIQQVKFVINFAQPNEQVCAEQYYNQSNSNSHDLSGQQLKIVQVRQSKNTYRQRLENKESNGSEYIDNKSCMARPNVGQLGRQEIITSPMTQNSNINDILMRWKLNQNDGSQSQNSLKIRLKQRMEKQKQLFNGDLMGKNQEYEVSVVKQRIRGPNAKKHRSVQTEGESRDFQALISNLQFTQNQWHRAQSQNTRLSDKLKQEESSSLQLKQLLSMKQKQCSFLKDNSQKMMQNQKKLLSEYKRLQNKVQQLQRQSRSKQNIIKEFESKNTTLQKQLQKTIRLNSSQNLQNNHYSLKVISPNTNHKECHERIETLQEYIFDIEQKSIGVDLEIDKRVKIIGEHLEFNIKRTIHQEYQDTIRSLKQELERSQQKIKMLQNQKKQDGSYKGQKQKQLLDREQQVKRMYEELVTEWKDLDRDKNKFKQGNFVSLNNYNSFPPLKPSNDIEPQKNQTARYKRQNYYDQKYNYQSSRELRDEVSPKYCKLGYKSGLHQKREPIPRLSSPRQPEQRLSMVYESDQPQFARYSFGKQLKQRVSNRSHTFESNSHNQMNTINQKIHKLREQINRELDFIH